MTQFWLNQHNLGESRLKMWINAILVELWAESMQFKHKHNKQKWYVLLHDKGFHDKPCRVRIFISTFPNYLDSAQKSSNLPWFTFSAKKQPLNYVYSHFQPRPPNYIDSAQIMLLFYLIAMACLGELNLVEAKLLHKSWYLT